MEAGYRLRVATERDLAALPEIERRAAALFAGHGFPGEALDQTCTPDEYAAGLAWDGLFVAVDGDDAPVGFALMIPCGDGAHLEEIDVDPAHGRAGIGRALVAHVCAEARRRGYDYVTLTTYAHLPWNAPWYEAQGFRVLARGEIGPALQRIVDHEVEDLHAPERRVTMRRRVSFGGAVLRWTAVAWFSAVVALSVIASGQPLAVLPWSRMIPGRDKTGHFLLMGGLAFLAVLAFSGRHLRGRRVSTTGVFAVVAVFVLIEEGVQWWLPRRTFSLEDLAWSLAGVAVFGALAEAWRRWRTR